ncbi:hypothetical protein WA158_007521 [Blastocystis sp. Blastoise]
MQQQSLSPSFQNQSNKVPKKTKKVTKKNGKKNGKNEGTPPRFRSGWDHTYHPPNKEQENQKYCQGLQPQPDKQKEEEHALIIKNKQQLPPKEESPRNLQEMIPQYNESDNYYSNYYYGQNQGNEADYYATWNTQTYQQQTVPNPFQVASLDINYVQSPYCNNSYNYQNEKKNDSTWYQYAQQNVSEFNTETVTDDNNGEYWYQEKNNSSYSRENPATNESYVISSQSTYNTYSQVDTNNNNINNNNNLPQGVPMSTGEITQSSMTNTSTPSSIPYYTTNYYVPGGYGGYIDSSGYYSSPPPSSTTIPAPIPANISPAIPPTAVALPIGLPIQTQSVSIQNKGNTQNTLSKTDWVDFFSQQEKSEEEEEEEYTEDEDKEESQLVIHDNNTIHKVVQTMVVTEEELHDPKDILLNQARLMKIAGEITEYEEAYLQSLIINEEKDVPEAMRRYSLGDMTALVTLLHSNDAQKFDEKDEAYAQHLLLSNDYTPPKKPLPIPSASLKYPICDSSFGVSSGVSSSGSSSLVSRSSIPSVNQSASSISYSEKSNFSVMNQPVNEFEFRNFYGETGSDLIPVNLTDSMLKSPLPPLFIHNDCLCGLILKRTHTKVIFKKWNRCLFICKHNFLQLYRTESDWLRNGPIYWQTNYHAFMHVTPIVRKTYENILVFTFELVENPRTVEHEKAAIQKSSFDSRLPIRLIAKFGSSYYGIVKALFDNIQTSIIKKVEEVENEV